MAKAAGAYAQGVSWGFHTAEEVREGGADHIAHDFAELNLRLDAFAEGLR
jgi:phosphoglycolate phosphatase